VTKRKEKKPKWTIELHPLFRSIWCFPFGEKAGVSDLGISYHFGTVRKPVEYSGSNGDGTFFVVPCSEEQMWQRLEQIHAEGAEIKIVVPEPPPPSPARKPFSSEFNAIVDAMVAGGS